MAALASGSIHLLTGLERGVVIAKTVGDKGVLPKRFSKRLSKAVGNNKLKNRYAIVIASTKMMAINKYS